ncbi:hypothetical protein ACFLQV_04925, partial [Calditrichota bacterium]
MKTVWLIIVLSMTFTITAQSAIVNFSPGDSFDQANSDLEEGDTLLLEPGYYEEVSWEITKPITLASWFIISGNPEYIGSTVLDNDRMGEPIVGARFQYPVPDDWTPLVVVGLTLTSCNSRIVLADYIDVEISDCLFTNNPGWIWLHEMNRAVIRNSAFVGHRVNNYELFSIEDVENVTFDNIVVNGSRAEEIMYFIACRYVWLNRCSIFGNTYSENGILYIANHGGESRYDFTNSIIYNQDAEYEMVIDNEDSRLFIDYCDIRDFENTLLNNVDCFVSLGDSLIDADPMVYLTEVNDIAFDEDSPCIDAGDPNAAEDPDGSRMDIGASNMFRASVLHMTIKDALIEATVQDVEVYIDPLPEPVAVSGDDGTAITFIGANRYLTLRFESELYNSLTIDSVNAENTDTLFLDVYMVRPEISLNRRSLNVDVVTGATISHDLRIFNDGAGVLEWSAERHLSEDYAIEPFV